MLLMQQIAQCRQTPIRWTENMADAVAGDDDGNTLGLHTYFCDADRIHNANTLQVCGDGRMAGGDSTEPISTIPQAERYKANLCPCSLPMDTTLSVCNGHAQPGQSPYLHPVTRADELNICRLDGACCPPCKRPP